MKLESIFSSSSNGSLLTAYIQLDYALSKNIVKQWEIEGSNGDKIYCYLYSDNHYEYGLIQGDYERYGHSKGYVWSSRASVMNKLFGLELTDVWVKYPDSYTGIAGIAYPVKTIRELLPEGFSFEREETDTDIYYNLVSDTPINRCGTIWKINN